MNKIVNFVPNSPNSVTFDKPFIVECIVLIESLIPHLLLMMMDRLISSDKLIAFSATWPEDCGSPVWIHLIECRSLNFKLIWLRYYILRVHMDDNQYFLRLSLIADLTQWGRVTHICDGYITIIGSDNGLSPGRRQAIIWINAGILLIRPLGINFSEILMEIKTFSFKKMHLKVSSVKRRPKYFASASMC